MPSAVSDEEKKNITIRLAISINLGCPRVPPLTPPEESEGFGGCPIGTSIDICMPESNHTKIVMR